MSDYNRRVWTVNELDKKQFIKLAQLSNKFMKEHKNNYF